MKPLYLRIAVMITCYVTSQCALAQAGPVVMSAGHIPPIPLVLAPGQIVTLYVSGLTTNLAPGQSVSAQSTPLPTNLGGVSATMTQFSGPSPLAIPLLMIFPVQCQQAPCTLIGITIQVPFELNPNYSNCGSCTNAGQIVVSNGMSTTGPIGISPVPAQVQVLRGPNLKAFVVHADGQPVTFSNPAITGEEIVMYASGLGLPAGGPRLKSGDVTPSPAPLAGGVLSYDYRMNASPSRAQVAATDPYLRFIGMSPGSISLYQVNFVVPPAPSTLQECDNIFVSSNLTVTLMSGDSFDGAEICVKSVMPQ